MPAADLPLLRGIDELSPVLLTAAQRFGTPVYVLDVASVSRAASELETAFPAPWVRQYSLKANDLPAVTALLRKRGWGANVVSTGEWQLARGGGISNDALTFEGIGKTDAQLEFAVLEAAGGRPLRWLAIESAQEADRLARLASWHRLGHDGRPPLDILLRLNPQVSPETRDEFAVGRAASKFGMTDTEILALIRCGALDDPGLRVRGIHVHAGSDLKSVAAWAEAGLRAAILLREIASINAAADTIDFGGGFPLTAAGEPGPIDFRTALTAALDQAGLTLPARAGIEPGRFLVGGAGWLVSSVLHARTSLGYSQQAMAVLDAGMTEFIRPALYGSHHPAHAIPLGRWPADALATTSLEGPVCESTDSFGTHLLPPLQRGDVVAIQNAGAKAASITSRYNGRPAPAEVLAWPDGSLERCLRPEIVPLASDTYPAPELAPVFDTSVTSLHCS